LPRGTKKKRSQQGVVLRIHFGYDEEGGARRLVTAVLLSGQSKGVELVYSRDALLV